MKLKENPREWRKFTAVMMVLFGLGGIGLRRRDILSSTGLWIWFGCVPVVLLLSWVRPRWFRGFYRGGMTVSHALGRVMGGVLLTVMFFLVLTPLGLWLRLLGKDLLGLKRRPERATYWEETKTNRHFDRQF